MWCGLAAVWFSCRIVCLPTTDRAHLIRFTVVVRDCLVSVVADLFFFFDRKCLACVELFQTRWSNKVEQLLDFFFILLMTSLIKILLWYCRIRLRNGLADCLKRLWQSYINMRFKATWPSCSRTLSAGSPMRPSYRTSRSTSPSSTEFWTSWTTNGRRGRPSRSLEKRRMPWPSPSPPLSIIRSPVSARYATSSVHDCPTLPNWNTS